MKLHKGQIVALENGREGVKRACTDLLDREHIPWFRMNSGKVKAQFGGWIQMCKKGTADILAAPNLPHGIANIPTPVFLWIETKASDGGRISPEQLEFANEVTRRGHIHLFVTDARQVQEWLKENRAR